MSAVYIYKNKWDSITSDKEEVEIELTYQKNDKIRSKQYMRDFKNVKENDIVIIYNVSTDKFVVAKAAQGYSDAIYDLNKIKVHEIESRNYSTVEFNKIINYFNKVLTGFTFKKITNDIKDLKYPFDNGNSKNKELIKLAKIIYNNQFLITNYKEYLNKIDYFSTEKNSKIIYRGQTEEWDLVPSIFRNYKPGIENKLYKNIRKFNLDELDQQDNFINELIKMQHYGIPSPLLDWTENPMTALFFSISGSYNKDGYINICFPDNIHDFNEELYKDLSYTLKYIYTNKLSYNKLVEKLNNKKFIEGLFSDNEDNFYFINPVYENERIRSQSGLFSLSLLINEKNYSIIKDDIIKTLIKEQENKIINKLNDEFPELKEQFLKNIFEIIFNHISEILKTDNYSNKSIVDVLGNNFTNNNNNINTMKKIKFQLENRPKDKFRGKKIDKNLLNFIIKYIYNKIFDLESKIKEKVLLENDRKEEIKSKTLIDPKNSIELIIPAEYKADIKKDLNKLFNINAATVYPDLEGYVQYVNDQFASSGGVNFD